MSHTVVQSITRSLSIAMLVALSASPMDGAPRETARRNEAGAVVQDEDGRRFTYSRSEWLTRHPSEEASQIATSDSSRIADKSQGPFAAPVWSYGIFGSGIGASNIVMAVVGGELEIILGGSQSTFGDDDYWYSVKYDAASDDYHQSFISPHYPEGIRRIEIADIWGDAALEVVVALENGRVVFHDLASKLVVGEATTGATGLNGMKLADLDGDGANEIIVCNRTDLFVHAADGALKWHVPVGGEDLVVAAMDTDPALEIAVTDGSVVDAATHSVQWTWPAGFGAMLETADIDADSLEELIAGEEWDFVWSFDVDRQLPKWSIPIFDVGAIHVTDIDGDSVQELLVGEGQWGDVIAFDTVTQQEEWSIPNPEHGVTDVAVGDVDGDGTVELLWGSGATSSGADRLYVADWTVPTIEWQNIQLDGPFVGPEMGDVDGDGLPEVVVVSSGSNANYGSGQIVVLDMQLRVRAISDEIVGGFAWTGAHDLELVDIDGDGDLEIAVAADRLYDGVIEIYDFDTVGVFTLEWTNVSRPEGAPFHSVRAADIDGDGAMEIVGGGGREHSGAAGVFIYVYDYSSGLEEWHSLQMGPIWGSIPGLELADLDSDGAIEIAGMVDGGDVYVFDGPSKLLEGILFGEFTAMGTLSVESTPRLLLGDMYGDVVSGEYAGGTYSEAYRKNWVSERVEGVSKAPGHALGWIGSGGNLRLARPNATIWQSALYGESFGERVVVHPESPLFFSAGSYAVIGFRASPP